MVPSGNLTVWPPSLDAAGVAAAKADVLERETALTTVRDNPSVVPIVNSRRLNSACLCSIFIMRCPRRIASITG